MTKEEKIKSFDSNGFATNKNLFGLPFSEEESEVIVLGVPWEVTVSYGNGTVNAPEAIKEASLQVDLYDPLVRDAWKKGIFLKEINQDLKNKSDLFRSKAESYLDGLAVGKKNLEELLAINKACGEMVEWVEQECLTLLNNDKKLVLLGGDHSTPLGYLKALASRNESFGILQVDAHADLRETYEGFDYSHASIMYNALKLRAVERLVQVGIRDYCESELDLIQKSDNRVTTFFDRDLKQDAFKGVNWDTQCENIVSKLPQKVYISFDIDGLDPKLCPNTGTPVAGGFEVEETFYLLEKVVKSGREIIGIDLNEVSPREDEWDANVGARVLYRLCNLLNYKTIEE